MKRILLFLLLFVNLQIVFHNGILDCSFTSVYAQHMTREAGDNCYDTEIGWYHSPFSDCRDVEVTPKKCQYCGTSFNTDLAVLQHEKDCPSKPKDYECSYCHSGFDDLSSLNTHENQCPERFKCQSCGSGFSSQYDLDNHTCGGQNNQGGGDQTGGGLTGGGLTGGGPVVGGGSTNGSKDDGNTPTINLPEVVVKGFVRREQYLVQSGPWACAPFSLMNSLYTMESTSFTCLEQPKVLAEVLINHYDSVHRTDIRNSGVDNILDFLRELGYRANMIEISKIKYYFEQGVNVIGVIDCGIVNGKRAGHAVSVIGTNANVTELTVIDSSDGQIRNYPISVFIAAYYVIQK